MVASCVFGSNPGVACDVTTGEQLTDSSATVQFHLWVSNQSFDIDPVDIAVYIDGVQVVCDDFSVEAQHIWIRFEFTIESGEHEMQVIGNDGTSELTKGFSAPVELLGTR